MVSTIGRSVALALLFGALVSAGTLDQPRQSAAVAKQLTTALLAQRLDAIAAKDPDEPDRFVAALFFPDSQLLVVSARYASAPLLEGKLSQKQYRDVYLDLQGAPVPGSSLFYQDMKADGLCASQDMVADILYDGSATPKIFDADWDKHKTSQKAYEHEYVAADQQYSRLLTILLAQMKPQS
jgi:hypothetical protein